MRFARSLFALGFWLILLLTVGYLMGFLTKGALVDWYADLNRSPLTPPNYVFGIAWSFLYILIAISGWLIWGASEQKDLAWLKKLFLLQLLLNWLWTPVFFYWHRPDWAMVVILMLLALIWAIVYQTHANRRKIMWLMLPYALWVSFASYLNLYILIYN